MPIPDGASPPFAWTLQPGGATFDPPIQIEYPNMSGLTAGTVAYFLSFNHDTRRFEIICSGHVRDDSSVIVSDTGLDSPRRVGLQLPAVYSFRRMLSDWNRRQARGDIGGQVQLKATATPPGGTFLWDIESGGVQIVGGADQNAVSIKGNSAGAARVRANNRLAACPMQ